MIESRPNVIIYAPEGEEFDNSTAHLRDILTDSGVYVMHNELELGTPEDWRNVTVVAVGDAVPQYLDHAIAKRVKKIALVAPRIRTTHVYRDSPLLNRPPAVLRWMTNIDRGRFSVMTWGPQGEQWIGADFVKHVDPESPFPDEAIHDMLRTPRVPTEIVSFVKSPKG